MDPLANAAYRTCFVEKLLGPSDDQFVALSFAGQSGRSAIGTIVAPCDAKAPGGVSPFRTAFDAQFRQTNAAAKTADLTCAIDALKTKISDADLTDAMLDASAAGSVAVTNLKALEDVAYRGCADGSPAPSPTVTPNVRIGKH
ncbi:MAG TPA: hypothetical protein VHV82_04365 [Sporichthyaceae bacterium]|jgi:hypothetical protein|nr:hypothetical protein [Sporichthyaceae bacterium]